MTVFAPTQKSGKKLGNQTPRYHVFQPYKKSKIDIALRFLAREANIHLDPWQELVFRDWLAVNDDGLWTHIDAGLVVARQEGKSELFIARILVALFLDKDPLTIYSAHRLDASVRIFKRLAQVIQDSPTLVKLVKTTKDGRPGSYTVGREAIETLEGCEVQFRTRQSGGGRSFTADLVIFDEAMVLSDAFAGDVRPTLASRPNPQIIAAGSAGNKKSEHFGSLRNDALSDDPGDACWHEWSIDECDQYCDTVCEDHPDPFDEDTWYLTNPSLGYRKTIRFLRSERKKHGDEFFKREYLSIGTWPQPAKAFSEITEEAWARAEDASLGIKGKMVFAITTSPDRLYTAILTAGYTDDESKVLVEVTGNPEDGIDQREGTRWVIPRAKYLWKTAKPYAFVIDTKGQASTFIEPLRDAGIKVISPTAHEYATYCAKFAVGVTGTKEEPRYVHHLGQPELTLAVAGAAKRKCAGLWAWARANDSSNIIALEAGTLALFGLEREAAERGARDLWAV